MTTMTRDVVAMGAGAAVREVQAGEVRAWVERGEAVIVDVREPDEHARERIPGARLVPLSRFDAAEAAAGARPGQRVVMQCRSGRRSLEAAQRAAGLSSRGLEVVSLAGGIEAWKKAGLPTEVDRAVSRVSVMRQVQMVVGAGVLGGSALAWLVHPALVAIPAFLGAGLLFAGATGTCALAAVLSKMPWNRSGATSAAGCSTGPSASRGGGCCG